MNMRRILPFIAMFLCAPLHEAQAARIKDVARLYGKPVHSLTGWGLVTGLNRTGDSSRNEVTIRSLANRLQGLGTTIAADDIISRNVAVVMVTARMPADVRSGHLLDVEVSSAGDARSLEGGVLQLTLLYSVDSRAYAQAWGPLVIGGFSADAVGNQVRKNHPTTGRIPEGAEVMAELPNRFDLSQQEQLEWIVNQPDFTTANRMATAVNEHLQGDYALARDGGTVVVEIPDIYRHDVVAMVAEVESITMEVDAQARVVVNERTGTVVMGADVSISAVAVAHGGLTIEVQRQSNVSQPGLLSGGQTVVLDNTRIKVEEQEGRVSMVEGATIGDLVNALNNLGVTPRDLITILMSIHRAGGLHAIVETL